MFCEGTRFTKKKHELSMKYAREKGIPELKHHLLPRTKGFSLLAKGATGRSMLFFNFKIFLSLEIKFFFLNHQNDVFYFYFKAYFMIYK